MRSLAVLLTFATMISCSSTNAIQDSSCLLGNYTLTRQQNDKPVEVSGEYFKLGPVRGDAQYYADLSIGNPPQIVHAILDTGSSNLAILGSSNICKTCQGGTYSPSSSAQNQGSGFDITYQSASIELKNYKDTFKLPCDTSELSAQFGVITSVAGGQIDSVLGLAYPKIAEPHDTPLPTFLDLLFDDNQNIQKVFTLQLCGNRSGSTFFLGRTDPRVAEKDIIYTPIIEESYYVIDARYIQVKNSNGTTTKLGDFPSYQNHSGIPTIIDSGTTRSYFPTLIVEAVRTIMRKVAMDNHLSINDEFWTTDDPNSPNYSRQFTDAEIRLFPLLQIVVRGDSDKADQLVTIDFPPERYLQQIKSGERVFSLRQAQGAVLIGQAVMEGYYIVFDRQNKRLGFAPSDHLCGT